MLCWLAGNTSQVRKFDAAMKQIKELNPDAEKWLRNIPLEMWTMSFDGGHRYGQATTNMIESFNGCIRSARFLPVTSMASAHKIIPYNEQRGIFEVTTARYKTQKGYWKGGNKHTIDLGKGFCSCGKWSRYHSPCSHIVAGCLMCSLDWKQYIEPSHSLTTLYEMWKYEFFPLANQAYWTFPLANNWERYGTGQSQRIRTEMDNSRKAISCGRCGQEGHTRRSSRCPQNKH
ncbi:hypothetical protein DCAR_0832770 [Daucus carota subsp. sativus]|uniref:SWIM-type domain-containing protein n=1 Tax=Daucus carota subsp. sativus TaxID=79200 RepID=A0AAF0XVM2_DAUCS|nr:hypothetical protein DCAR_0832770 [Daucus carota subsp. sativus]